MKTARDVYPNSFKDAYDIISNYQPMLQALGNIVLQIDDNNCMGDSRIIYRDGDMYGWLQFGWGSCTGCDSLQRCNSYEDVQELMDELRGDIKWFDNHAEAYSFFQKHDWKTDHSDGAKQREFVSKALIIFGEVNRKNLEREKKVKMKEKEQESAERLAQEILDDKKLEQLNQGLKFGKFEEAKAAYNLGEAKKLQAIIVAFPEQPLAIITAMKEYVDNFEEIHKQIETIRDDFDVMVKRAVERKGLKDGQSTKKV